MKTKYLIIALLISTLSSCCWLVRYDCAENASYGFSIPVEINYNDTLIAANTPLPITIKSSVFQSNYTAEGYDQSSFSISITWFDGNFASSANSKVNLLNSNTSALTLEEYNSYAGALPDDIEFELAFPIPGYYLIQFWGSASKELKDHRRCACNIDQSQYFEFSSNKSNSQYFQKYSSSLDYSASLSELGAYGAYFIKVE